MRLRFTAHARRRMAEYNVSEDDVESVVAHPSYVARSHHSRNLVYIGQVAGQDVYVVVVPGSVPPRVVTLWVA